ncbi:hypothetical protein L1987_08678 [Smallanthus sonchifolius]|uniref:Uncharacterized protein n=1 Tax=Smallanthus sonchifolius TaxID=185202 RepID=A0ACB9JLU9_9ASTR|nr:hypothetical protein L1987_08678 [Smallanthus sonchifolius]
MFSRGIHILSAGSSDFLQNYYINPALRKLYKPSKVADFLLKSYRTFIENLVANHPDLKLVAFDVYHPLLGLITKPSFFESRRGCCGTGIVETSLLCNSRLTGTCSNATGYVFWDGFHPSEAANQILAQSLLEQGLSLIS